MANVDMERGDVDIVQNTVIQSILDSVEIEKNQLPPSIYMVASVFRDLSPSCFNPRVVSIGPLHRDDEKLQEFEVHKASAVHHFLHHHLVSPPEMTLQECVQKVTKSINRIRECYAGMKTYSDAELAKMMVIDACFILEFIYQFSNHRPVVRNMLLQNSVVHDLVLVENQIPFFVLNDIFQCTLIKTGFEEDSLSTFIFPVLKVLHLFNANLQIGNIGTDSTHDHILGLLHECYRSQSNLESDFSYSTIHSAVDLDRAGVNFKPNKDAKWPMAMEVKLQRFPCLSWFWSSTTLRMPVLRIHDGTEVILRNLMAYEASYPGRYFVTSYVAAMDMLVNTEEDIAKLVESKVLVNLIGSDDEAASTINNIGKEVTWPDFFYHEEWKNLDRYCNGYWPKNVARLKRTYFSSPWNIIALLAGIVLFGLTVVQTVFAV